MKRLLFSFIMILGLAVSIRAMGYEEARERAWYLTDKMAYELNLTEEQYNRAYEINLDYLLNIRTDADLFGPYWTYRNEDFRCVLFDWQYSLFQLRTYFYRPLSWLGGRWHMSLYNHYDRDYFFFRRPVVVNVYRGRPGVARGPRSPYAGMAMRRGDGMRDTYYHGRRDDMRGRGDGHMPSPGNRREWNADRRPGMNRQPDYGNGGKRYDGWNRNGNQSTFNRNSNNAVHGSFGNRPNAPRPNNGNNSGQSGNSVGKGPVSQNSSRYGSNFGGTQSQQRMESGGSRFGEGGGRSGNVQSRTSSSSFGKSSSSAGSKSSSASSSSKGFGGSRARTGK